MATREDRVHRARREVVRLAHTGLNWPTMAARMSTAIRTVVPFGFHCWHTLDPDTLLMTGDVAWETESGSELQDGGELLPYFEYAMQDVNQWAFLARTLWPVGILSQATQGNPELSPRYRGLLKPAGIVRELRASFVSDGACWGSAGFYRTEGQPDFTEEEAKFVASLGPIVADGFRRALLVTATLPNDCPDGPGLIVLDRHDQVESVTQTALRWLDELVDEGVIHSPIHSPFPLVVHAVAARARQAGNRLVGPQQSARARAYTGSGRWLTLYGMCLEDTEDGRVAVIVEPARPQEIAPLIVSAYGLTEREREVTRLVITGASTAEIARTLSISPLTVQDHLKVVFEKTGVRSRRELVAKVFLDHYWPHVQAGEMPTAAGRFPQPAMDGMPAAWA